MVLVDFLIILFLQSVHSEFILQFESIYSCIIYLHYTFNFNFCNLFYFSISEGLALVLSVWVDIWIVNRTGLSVCL